MGMFEEAKVGIYGGGDGDGGGGEGEIFSVGLSEDESGENGGAGVFGEERWSRGERGLAMEERDWGRGFWGWAIDEHGDEFIAAEGLDEFDEGERVGWADDDGFDAETLATGLAPAGEFGGGFFEGDDGEGEGDLGEGDAAEFPVAEVTGDDDGAAAGLVGGVKIFQA